MKKIYHLSTCSTCQRIIKDINPGNEVKLQDIKANKITAQQIDELKKMAGSYEALFSRRAMKYKSMGLAQKNLSQDDYRQLILDEYTFLKRPVVVSGDRIFVGNSKKTVEAAKQGL
ncbi:MAG: hypothetical protein COA57_02930 [Flavobacteriales bacterium]|nr:MAG: hypothetical protein COA57_02930 [Flavobacteriales bacterium]